MGPGFIGIGFSDYWCLVGNGGSDKNIDTVEFSIEFSGRESQMDKVHETFKMDGVIGICLHIKICIYACICWV